MHTTIEKARRGSRGSRLAGPMPALALLAAVLTACSDQPTESGDGRAVPGGPSLSLNAACDTALGGQAHTDSILAAETWSRTGNPHRVDHPIMVEGAGVLVLEPGVVVCFGSGGSLWFNHGGRLVAEGLDTLGIVLTAADFDAGWWGVWMKGSPAAPSSLKHVRLEHTRNASALATFDLHALHVDSAVFRKNDFGIYLGGRGSSLRRSLVDTVLYQAAAVTLGSVTTWEQNEIRGAPGVGLAVLGTHGITLLGGRIEGSGGVGLQVTTTGAGFVDTDPVRVVGGASYPAELVVSAFPRIYPALADQDSLLGNARDTLVVTGGVLQQFAYPTQALPWRVTGDITVQHYGILRPMPGAVVAFDDSVKVTATNGGRVVARGTKAAPVRLTNTSATGCGWGGLVLQGAPTLSSYLTNVRIEHVKCDYAVYSLQQHTVVIDSAVFRQNGSAAYLSSANSRLSRSRVDTTLLWQPAVLLYEDNVTLESTLIRKSAGTGLSVHVFDSIQVLSCDIRDSWGYGIELWAGVEVHNCNLVDNGSWGIIAQYSSYGTNVENNWWGDAAGPAWPAGDGVDPALDYTPWRTTPYVLPYVP